MHAKARMHRTIIQKALAANIIIMYTVQYKLITLPTFDHMSIIYVYRPSWEGLVLKQYLEVGGASSVTKYFTISTVPCTQA